MPTKTRSEKYFQTKEVQIKTLDVNFADMKKGQRMLIATPEIIHGYICNIPYGEIRDIKQMRTDLAHLFNADVTCPVTTSIYLRTVAEYNHELAMMGNHNICPFWRVILPGSILAKKLSFSLENYKD